MRKLTISQKYEIKDLKSILKSFENIVKGRDSRGRPFLLNGNNQKNKTDKILTESGDYFNMRHREAWGNWLLCSVLTFTKHIEFIFREEVGCDAGDGEIINKITRDKFLTEHVIAIGNSTDGILSAEELIISSINSKLSKGYDDAKNRTLVVYLYLNETFPVDLSKIKIDWSSFSFGGLFIFFLCIDDKTEPDHGWYVVSMDSKGNQIYKVIINSNFTDYEVEVN